MDRNVDVSVPEGRVGAGMRAGRERMFSAQ
jgi:hypothetical protein